MVHDLVEIKFGPNRSDDDVFDFINEKMTRNHVGIVGKDGAFSDYLFQIIKRWYNWNISLHEVYETNISLFKESIINTVRTVYNMWLIRKVILPMSTCGEQYESFEFLPKWTKLIAKHCKRSS